MNLRINPLKPSILLIFILYTVLNTTWLSANQSNQTNFFNHNTLFTDSYPQTSYQSVRDLYHIALKHSPNLQLNRSALDILKANKLTANSVYYPTVSADFNLRRSEDTKAANSNQNILSISATQFLYNAEAFARADKIDIQLDAQRLAIEATRQQLILDLAQRWTAILLAKDNKTLSVLEVQSSKKILDKAKQSLEVGVGKKLDLAQAEAAYKLAIATQIQRQSDHQIALQELANLTGAKIQFIPPWHEQSFDVNHQESYVTKLKHNINIQRQLKILDSSSIEIEEKQGQYYPQISLIFSYNQIENIETGSNISINDPLLITLKLSWELFSGFRTTAATDQAYAQLNQEKARLRSTVLQQKSQLNSIIAQLQADEKRLPAIKQQAEAAKISYDAFLQGYELGTEELSEVLQAQSNYQQATINLTQSTYQNWINYLNFKFLLGQITPKDLP